MLTQKRPTKLWVIVVCAALQFLFISNVRGDCFGVNSLGMNDLAIFASQWLDECTGPSWCVGTDIDQSQRVDFVDFALAFKSASPLVLVENGVCNVSIKNVVQGMPSTVETYAAQQLQNAFVFATGLQPAINPSIPAAIQIKIGVASRFSSGVGDSSDHAYTIRRSLDDNIELVGNSTAAVLWAVTDFCDKVLHVSWPIADENMVLEGSPQSRIEVRQLCIITSPDFSRRGWTLGENTNGYAYENNIDDWMSHNRQSITTVHYPDLNIADSLSPYNRLVQRGIEPDTTIHSFGWLVSCADYFSTHPEYFPLINGQRVCDVTGDVGTQLCLSNSNVQDIIYSKAFSAIRTYSKMKCFGIVPNDSSSDGWCQCAACKALDGNQINTGVYSNRLIWFVNQIANRLATNNPGKYIGTLAYSNYVQPPDINVASNVYVTFCTGGRNLMRKLTDPTDLTNASIMQNLNGWLAKASNVSLWDYYWYSGIARCPAPFSHTLSQEFSELHALGLKGVSSQTISTNWPGLRLACYTFARSTWDTSLNFDEILMEYCKKRYGTASSVMNSYYSMYENILSQRVPILMTIYGAGEQYISGAFTNEEIGTLSTYLTTATNTVGLTVSQASAIADDSEMFAGMCQLRIDPATISDIGANIIPNADAESGSTGWGTNIQLGGDYTFSVATDNQHSGSKSFKIQCNGASGLARWYQTGIPIQDGQKYVVRFWVRADTGAWGNVLCLFGATRIEIGTGDSGNKWMQVVCPEVTANGTTLAIYLQSCGLGNVYYDDIFVAALPH